MEGNGIGPAAKFSRERNEVFVAKACNLVSSETHFSGLFPKEWELTINLSGIQKEPMLIWGQEFYEKYKDLDLRVMTLTVDPKKRTYLRVPMDGNFLELGEDIIVATNLNMGMFAKDQIFARMGPVPSRLLSSGHPVEDLLLSYEITYALPGCLSIRIHSPVPKGVWWMTVYDTQRPIFTRAIRVGGGSLVPPYDTDIMTVNHVGASVRNMFPCTFFVPSAEDRAFWGVQEKWQNVVDPWIDLSGNDCDLMMLGRLL